MPDATATPSTSIEPASPATETPPAAEQQFGMEDFADLTLGEEEGIAPIPPAEGEEGEEAPPAPAEEEDPGLKPTEAPPAPAAPKGARDYSQFDPDTAAALKTMSNKGFAWATKQLEAQKADAAALAETRAEVEKLKTGALPDSWHSEPEAYKIAPKYAEHESAFHQAQAATHQYANALEALALGDPFEVPGTDGKMISIDPGKLDERGRIRLKTQLESYRTHHYEQQREHANAANQFRDTFKKKYDDAANIIVREMNKLFPIDAKQTKELDFEKQIIEMFPPEFRNHPSTKMAARQGVYVNKLIMALAEKDKKIAALEGLGKDRKLAGGIPKRNGAAPANAGDDSNKEYSLKDFES